MGLIGLLFGRAGGERKLFIGCVINMFNGALSMLNWKAQTEI